MPNRLSVKFDWTAVPMPLIGARLMTTRAEPSHIAMSVRYRRAALAVGAADEHVVPAPPFI